MTHKRQPTTKSQPKPKVALGMSGGVDSSLAAHLLVEQGYDVTGIFLECWRAPGCRSEEDRQDALKVALKLGIPFQVLDFKQAYKDRVVEYFFAEYEAGRTPNPDVMCNKEIKFGLFYDWAMAAGFEFVATGHYAQVTHDPPRLLSAVDEHKDQTYFLYLLQEEQLTQILFPLGQMKKTAVRQAATERQIHVATKKDSVGICFIGDINVHQFLADRLGENPGPVVDSQGNVIGRHTGLWFYTIGQRHGFTIDATTAVKTAEGETINKHNLPPFYVIDKLPADNKLVVGFGAETYRSQFDVTDIHWINDPPMAETVLVRIRHTGQLWPCQLTVENDRLTVSLDQPVQGLAEGQSAVFYLPQAQQQPQCLGGGIIHLDRST